MRQDGDYKYFGAISVFIMSATLLEVLFFYYGAISVAREPNIRKVAEITFSFFLASAVIGAIFIAFMQFVAKRSLAPLPFDNSKPLQKIESAIDGMKDGVLCLSRESEVILANRAATAMLGYSREELKGHSAYELMYVKNDEEIFVPDGADDNKSLATMNGACTSGEDIYTRKDGSKLEVSYVTTPLIINGRSEGVMLVFSDISKKKGESRKLLVGSLIAKGIKEGILITDAKQKVVFVNSYFESISGYQSARVVGKKVSLLRSGKHTDDFYKKMWDSIGDNGFWEGEIWSKKRDGSLFNAWLTITVAEDKGEFDGKFYIAVYHDISKRKTLEKGASSSKEEATYDELTGLADANRFNEALEMELTRRARYGGHVSLIAVGVDDFDSMDELHGVGAGNETLKELAALLKSNVRKIDTAARVSGETFIIATPHTNIKGAAALADNLRELIETHVFESVGRIRCSLGVAAIEDGDDGVSLVNRALEALKVSRSEGGNKVTLL